MKNSNRLTEAQTKFWYSRGRYISLDEHVLSNEAFLAGAKWAMKQTSELSPHIAQFIEMMILLGFLEEREEDNSNFQENVKV